MASLAICLRPGKGKARRERLAVNQILLAGFVWAELRLDKRGSVLGSVVEFTVIPAVAGMTTYCISRQFKAVAPFAPIYRANTSSRLKVGKSLRPLVIDAEGKGVDLQALPSQSQL